MSSRDGVEKGGLDQAINAASRVPNSLVLRDLADELTHSQSMLELLREWARDSER